MTPELRKLFPVTRNCIYLNHAAVCPLSIPVYERMQQHTRDLLEHGAVHYRDWFAAIRHTRELAAKFIHASPEDYKNHDQPYAPAAKRFEPGALNTAGVVGLGAAIELFEQVGIETIDRYLLELGDYLCERLNEKGYRVVSSRRTGEKSAVICCQHDRFSAEQLSRHLDQHRIITTPRLGRLRISPHFYNTREEIDLLVETLPG
ncbi:MAG: aminotransferase class V-fold PLP-dependent enzyme [Blastocatellia bacterium]